MISDKYQCIFIHIPKNAGTSIESKISADEGLINLLPDHRTILDMEPLSLQTIFSSYRYDQSISIARRFKYYLVRKKLGSFYKPASKFRYEHYFKFAIVRNPWSRAYSWYRNVMHDPRHQKKYNVPSQCSFDDFIKNHLGNQAPLRNQLYWLRDSMGNIPMDFIGRFENLESDFKKIARSIGLQNHELPKKRYTGKSASYKEAYSSHAKDIIRQRFKEEIDFFGFEFGE